VEVRTRHTVAHEFSVAFDVTIGGVLYDVCVDVTPDDCDVEVYRNSETVPVGWLLERLGYASAEALGLALVDGFYLDGPAGFDLFVRTGVEA
jgi:hypothetical protein